ncbi:glycine zipper 2TM domain-containing protein [Altererythrobacter sp. CC-YST694]|nr:glycine zipper 2TM domain-containing protein [Altererythrobacter sp. CC-YST694]
MRLCRSTILATAAFSFLAANPAIAGDTQGSPQVEEDYGAVPVLQAAPLIYSGPAMAMPYGQAGLPPQPITMKPAYSQEEREAWLRDCRRRYGDKDNGLGGAVIGGVLGGVAGNVIAGEGNRTIGTVVGATVGALAGAAIDKGEDKARTRDFCEDYLTRYEGNAEAYGGQVYGSYPYGAYSTGQVMWIPVVVGWTCKPKEEIVEEWPARRIIPAKPSSAKTKYIPVGNAATKTVPVKVEPAKPVK